MFVAAITVVAKVQEFEPSKYSYRLYILFILLSYIHLWDIKCWKKSFFNGFIICKAKQTKMHMYECNFCIYENCDKKL